MVIAAPAEQLIASHRSAISHSENLETESKGCDAAVHTLDRRCIAYSGETHFRMRISRPASHRTRTYFSVITKNGYSRAKKNRAISCIGIRGVTDRTKIARQLLAEPGLGELPASAFSITYALLILLQPVCQKRRGNLFASHLIYKQHVTSQPEFLTPTHLQKKVSK